MVMDRDQYPTVPYSQALIEGLVVAPPIHITTP